MILALWPSPSTAAHFFSVSFLSVLFKCLELHQWRRATGSSRAIPLMQFFCVCASMYFCIKSCVGIQVKLAGRKSALNPPHPHPHVVYSTDRSKAVVPVLVLLFVALWLILRGDLFYVLPCVILFLCFSVLLA